MSVWQGRKLRRGMTAPESTLWGQLRLRPSGFKFRRQHPSGPYIFDFFCRDAALAIKVDGMARDLGGNPQRDIQRDAWAQGQGIITLRFRADDVQCELEAVVMAIVERCRTRTPPPPAAAPLPVKGRGGI